MGKYTNTAKLPKKEQDELFVELAQTMGSVKNSLEAANLIRDLFSQQEALMLARRLKVAELLNNGYTYIQIRKALKVSEGTIAKVQAWIRLYGDGCRAVLKRKKAKPRPNRAAEPLGWRYLKKKYPMYFWPELLVNEIIKGASNREKQRLLKVIEGMRDKTRLTKQLLSLLS